MGFVVMDSKTSVGDSSGKFQCRLFSSDVVPISDPDYDPNYETVDDCRSGDFYSTTTKKTNLLNVSNRCTDSDGYAVCLPSTSQSVRPKFPPKLPNCPRPPVPKPSLNRDDRLCGNSFSQSIAKLRSLGWYWGPIGWEKAEQLLKDQVGGTFLVRDSSDDRYIFSLSFIGSDNLVQHVRIKYFKGQFSFGKNSPSSIRSADIAELIHKTIHQSRAGRFRFFLHPREMRTNENGEIVSEALAVEDLYLTNPLSRFRHRVFTLKHLARFAVRQLIRFDQIDQLPVTDLARLYLSEPQYFWEDDCSKLPNGRITLPVKCSSLANDYLTNFNADFDDPQPSTSSKI